MDLSIIIVNWNVRDLLDRCLASIFRLTKGIVFEVIVVDNASGDGSVAMIKEKYPLVHVVANRRNLGFAAGNNQGIRTARGKNVILLNPDTEIFIEDALTALVRFMTTHPDVAIVGPRINNPDGTLQPSVKRFPDLLSQALLMLKVQALWPSAPPFKKRLARDFDYDLEQPCDMVMGAAFMIRRKTLETVGLLDENYWIWFEEVDYCKMAAKMGLPTWYTPTATIVHYSGQSFNQVFGPKKQEMFDRAARYYFLKHHGRRPWLVLLALRPFSAAFAWLAILPKKFGWHGLKV
ncbi:MAG: glycosyltransferase family 2 protein [Patescibacteria group bacterium]|nr:glycosyltransferase family 2 protein [Patescibacteria group bacterium]